MHPFLRLLIVFISAFPQVTLTSSLVGGSSSSLSSPTGIPLIHSHAVFDRVRLPAVQEEEAERQAQRRRKIEERQVQVQQPETDSDIGDMLTMTIENEYKYDADANVDAGAGAGADADTNSNNRARKDWMREYSEISKANFQKYHHMHRRTPQTSRKNNRNNNNNNNNNDNLKVNDDSDYDVIQRQLERLLSARNFNGNEGEGEDENLDMSLYVAGVANSTNTNTNSSNSNSTNPVSPPNLPTIGPPSTKTNIIVNITIACTNADGQAGQDTLWAYQTAVAAVNADPIYSSYFNFILRPYFTHGNAVYTYDLIKSLLVPNVLVSGIIGGTTTSAASAIRKAVSDSGKNVPVMAVTAKSDTLSLPNTISNPWWFRITPTNGAEMDMFVDAALRFNLTVTVLFFNDSYGVDLLNRFQSQAILRGVNMNANPATGFQFNIPIPTPNENDAVYGQRVQAWLSTVQTTLSATGTPIYTLFALTNSSYTEPVTGVTYYVALKLIDAGLALGMLNPLDQINSPPNSYSSPPYGPGPAFNYLWMVSDLMLDFLANVIDRTLYGTPTAGLTQQQRDSYAATVYNLIGAVNIFGVHKRDNDVVVGWNQYTESQGTVRRLSIAQAFCYDAVITFARAFLSIFQQNRDYTQPSIVARLIASSSFVGSSGPISFSSNGERIGSRFAFVQLDQNALPAAIYTRRQIMSWSSVASLRLNDTFVPNFSGNSYALPASYPLGLPPFLPGFYQWRALPYQGAAPPSRYGACQILSNIRDSFFVISGAPTPSAAPLSDVWEYSFANQLWTRRLLTGDQLRPFFYGACTCSTRSIYTFGGGGADGIQGSMFEIDMSTGETREVLYATTPGKDTSALQNVQMTGVATDDDGLLFIAGGLHEAPNDILTFWLYDSVANLFNYYSPVWSSNSVIQWWSPRNPTYSLSVVDTTQIPPVTLTDKYAVVSYWFNTMSIVPAVNVSICLGLNDTLCAPYVILVASIFPPDIAMAYCVQTNILAPLFLSGTPLPDVGTILRTSVLNNIMYIVFGTLMAESSDSSTLWSVNLNCNPTLSLTASDGCGIVTQLTTFLSTVARHGHMPVQLGTDIVVQGGQGVTQMLNDMFVISTLDYSGSQLASTYQSPPPRQSHSFTVVGNQEIVFGGLGAGFVALNDMWSFNLDNIVWTQVASLGTPPTPRYGHTAVALNIGLYIFGGFDGSQPYSDLYLFSVPTSQWSRLNVSSSLSGSSAPVPRYYHTSQAYLDTSFLMYGGVDTSGATLNDLWLFTLSTLQWTLLWTSAAVGSAGVPLGMGVPVTDPVHCNHANGTSVCTACTDYPCPLFSVSSAIYQNYFYIAGGADTSSNTANAVFFIDIIAATQSASAVSPSQVWWSRGAPQIVGGASTGYAAMGSATIFDSWFFFGGYSLQYNYNLLQVYSFSNNSWTSISNARSPSTPSQRSGHALVAVGNTILSFGGALASPYVNVQVGSYLCEELWQFVLGPSAQSLVTDVNPNQRLTSKTTDVGSVTGNNYMTACTNGTYHFSNACATCPQGYYCQRLGANITYHTTYKNVTTVNKTLTLVPVVTSTAKYSNELLPCPIGTFGAFAGAGNPSACLPCPYGSYAPAQGQAQCLACPSKCTCNVGASAYSCPSVTTSASSFSSSTTQTGAIPAAQIQPSTNLDNTLAVASATTTASIVIAVVVLVLGIVYLALMCTNNQIRFLKYDYLFNYDHLTLKGYPLLRRQTSCGGFCTFGVFPVIGYFLFGLLLPYIQNNLNETRALVPSILVTNVITGNLMIEIDLLNYGPSCVSATATPDQIDANTGYGPCANLIDYATLPTPTRTTAINGTWPNTGNSSSPSSYSNSTADLNLQGITYACKSSSTPADPTKTCSLRWTCNQCYFPPPPLHTITFRFLEVGTSATSINWLMTASSSFPSDGINSGSIQPSTLSSSIIPPSGFLFRGTSSPSLVSVTLTPSQHTTTHPTASTVTGFILAYESGSGGAVVDSSSYRSYDGLTVQFALTSASSTLTTTVTERLTEQQFVAALIGALSAAIGAIGAAVGMLEMLLEAPILAVIGRAKQTSTHQLRVMSMNLFKMTTPIFNKEENEKDKPTGKQSATEMASRR